ncbi:PAM68 family protein [Leptolyngbya sp. AN02str]|uniref:PAM68 family protein n=1 Tax=Leptolyngbya sp. AN02str TaxID=3423363 RepID=UPI003D31F861
MASNSSSNSDSQAGNSKQDGGDRKPLPFEPTRRKSADKPAKRSPAPTPSPSVTSSAKPTTPSKAKQPGAKTRQSALAAAGIPDVVSNRMLRRMAIFCGVPTAMGVSSLFVSYFLVTQGVQLPHVAVLLVSLGLFGLGVLGLTYGALSASWEDEAGSLLGVPEFRLNFGRMVQTWRSAKDSTN